MPKYDSNEELKKALLKLNPTFDKPLTANKMAKALDYHKATPKVRLMIQELVNDKELKTTVDGRFEVYYIANAESDTSDNETDGLNAPKSSTTIGKNVDAEDKGAPVIEYTLPQKLHGYKLTESSKPDYEFQVGTPDGVVVDLPLQQRILVINRDSNYRFILEHPEDLFKAIRIFTDEMNYAHFLVKEISSGQYIKSSEDLSTDVLLFIEIQRHNKAGASLIPRMFYIATDGMIKYSLRVDIAGLWTNISKSGFIPGIR